MALPLAPNHACMSAANGRIDDCQASSRLCNDGLMEHTLSRNMQTHKACKRVICPREHTCNAPCKQGLRARHTGGAPTWDEKHNPLAKNVL